MSDCIYRKNKYQWKTQQSSPDKPRFHRKGKFFLIVLPLGCFQVYIWRKRCQSNPVFVNHGCTLESSGDDSEVTHANACSQVWHNWSRFSGAGTVVSFRSSPSDSIVQLGLSNFVNYIYVWTDRLSDRGKESFCLIIV